MFNSIPLKQLLVVFVILLAVGLILTLPLYKFNWRRFIRSSIFTKIIFWLPLFGLFLSVLYLPPGGRAIVLSTIIAIAGFELARRASSSHIKAVLVIYFLLFAIGLGHLYLIHHADPQQFINVLIALNFSSGLADVMAFFFGSYLGKHKLPAKFNKNKSWEGVLGEFVGAFIGITIVSQFIVPVVSIWLFVAVGLGCVIGDLANSYFKRRLNIKSWSNFIPGHGGFLDRFSSLAGSTALTFYYLKLIGG